MLTVVSGQLQLTGTAPKEGIFQVTVTAFDPAGLSASRGFLLTVLPATNQHRELALIAPQFNCATGVITFLTTGGDGTPIEFMAAGVKAWSTDPTGVVDELGRVWSETRIEQALIIERNRLKLGTSGGIYIMQVSTPVGVKTIKVMKQPPKCSRAGIF